MTGHAGHRRSAPVNVLAEYAQPTANPRDTTEASTRASFRPAWTVTRDRLPEISAPDMPPDSLQAALNRSPRAQGFMQLQRTINQSPRVQALAQLRTTVARSPRPAQTRNIERAWGDATRGQEPSRGRRADATEDPPGAARRAGSAFIGVGHELIHASHYGAGTYIGRKPRGSPHARVPGEYGDNVEEFLTIASPQERDKAKNAKVTSALEKLSGGTQQHSCRISQWDKLSKGLPTEAEIRAEHGLSIRHGHTTTANPSLYPGAKKGTDPGMYVKDAIDWITPHLDAISRPEQDVVAVGGPQRQGGQIVVDSKLSAVLKRLGVTAVGGVIGLGLIVGLFLSMATPSRATRDERGAIAPGATGPLGLSFAFGRALPHAGDEFVGWAGAA